MRCIIHHIFSAYVRLCCRACTHSGILSSCCVSVAMCRGATMCANCGQMVIILVAHALTTYAGGRDWVASGSDVSRLYSSVRSACKSCDMLIDSSCCGTVGLHSHAECTTFFIYCTHGRGTCCAFVGDRLACTACSISYSSSSLYNASQSHNERRPWPRPT